MSGGHAVGSPECLAVEPSSRSRILRRSSSVAGVPCRCWQAICRVRSPLPWECPTVLVGARLRWDLHAIAFAQSRRRAELPRSPVIVDARCAATGHLPPITASHPERAASQPRQRRPENSPCRQAWVPGVGVVPSPGRGGRARSPRGPSDPGDPGRVRLLSPLPGLDGGKSHGGPTVHTVGYSLAAATADNRRRDTFPGVWRRRRGWKNDCRQFRAAV